MSALISDDLKMKDEHCFYCDEIDVVDFDKIQYPAQQ